MERTILWVGIWKANKEPEMFPDVLALRVHDIFAKIITIIHRSLAHLPYNVGILVVV
jgi:hypothetical protein